MLDASSQTTSKIGTQPHPLAERLPKIKLSSQTPQNAPLDVVVFERPTKPYKNKNPPERQDPATPTRTQAPVPFTRKPTQATEPTSPTGDRHQKQQEL